MEAADVINQHQPSASAALPLPPSWFSDVSTVWATLLPESLRIIPVFNSGLLSFPFPVLGELARRWLHQLLSQPTSLTRTFDISVWTQVLAIFLKNWNFRAWNSQIWPFLSYNGRCCERLSSFPGHLIAASRLISLSLLSPLTLSQHSCAVLSKMLKSEVPLLIMAELIL